MERLGNDFNDRGSVLDKRELEELRRRKGECVKCGQKCFERKLFRLIPITINGKVLDGRCLDCEPLDSSHDGLMPAVARVATSEERSRIRPGPRHTSSGASVSSSRSARDRRSRGRARKAPSNQRLQRAQSERGGSLMNPAAARPPSSTSSYSTSRSSSDNLARETSMDSYYDAAKSEMTRYDNSSNEMMSPAESAQRPDDPEQAPHHPGQRQASATSNSSAASTGTSGSSVAVDVPQGELDDSTLHSTYDAASISDPIDSNHPLAAAPNNDDLQEALQRITGQGLSSEEAISTLEASGMAAHPTAAALLDYYRRSTQESQRSLLSSASTTSEAYSLSQQIPEISADMPNHGVLDRGGAVSFQHLGGGHPGQSLGSSNHRGTIERTSSRRSNARYITGSTRSLDSMSSFGDEPSFRYGSDSVSFGDSNYNGHHSASLDTSERRNSLPRLSSGASVASGQSRNSNVSAASQDVGLERLAGADDGDFVETLNVMRDYPDSMAVQLSGLQMLAEVMLEEEDFEILPDLGAANVIIEAMDADPSNSAIQIGACRALLNACGSLENQISFCDAGIVDPILRSMDTFPSNENVQEHAMAVLANLGAAEPNLDELLEKGAIVRIIEAMERHTDERQLQMKGCSAITNFASHTSPLKNKIMDLGGGGAVVVTMSLNQNDSELQEKALRAVRNLSANSDENKLKLAHIGGVDSVVTAMQIHRDEPGVQETGAWSLCNLAGHVDNRRLIGDCGGVDVTLRAMWVHGDLVSVQEWCMRALFTLTLDEYNGDKVLEVGGLSAIVTAMQTHVESPGVQEMGCAVLCNLASTQERRLLIVDEEALDAIVLAMVVFSEELMVQQQACQVLMQLAIAENFTAMQASNVPSLVEAAAERFQECEEPAEWLLTTLNEFAAHYEDGE